MRFVQNAVWKGVLGLVCLVGCSADHHAAKGRAALDRHDLVAAETSFRSALDRDPKHLDALGGLGWTYHLVGQRSAAERVFARCVDLAPEQAECLRGLGSIAMANGQVAVARDLLGRARAAAPDDPNVLASLALFELHAGDASTARDSYDELVQRFPDSVPYRLGLAEATLRAGDAEGALPVVEAALALPTPAVRHRALLWLVKARALVGASGGREDPERCAETAPAVRAWLDAADQAVEQAAALDVDLPELPAVKRQVLRRRAVLDRQCPVATPGAAAVLSGSAPGESSP